jgi:hypothetical protein
MGRRTDIEAYTVKELKSYATEYGIKGRSKMSPAELLVAVRKIWNDERIALEGKVLAAGPVGPGTVLMFTDHPGCVIRASSEVIAHPLYGSLYVLGEYVSLCDNCAPFRNGSEVEYMNQHARGEDWNGNPMGDPYRFFLYTLSRVPQGDMTVKTIARMSVAERMATIHRAAQRGRLMTEAEREVRFPEAVRVIDPATNRPIGLWR